LVDWYFKTQGWGTIDSWLRAHGDVAGTSSAFVLCIILGLISNTLVFAGINDFLVRGPVQRDKRNLAFFSSKKRVEDRIRGYFARKLSSVDDLGNPVAPSARKADFQSVFDDIDVEYVVLNKFTESRLVYVQEQYWYYMELHINLAVAVLLLAVSCMLRASAYGAIILATRNLLFLLGSAILFFFLVRMARRNYLRHCKKMFSLLFSFFDGVPEDGRF
jgi:hypothetical protein